MGVRVERTGPVTTVILDRPQVRNAVDRATAADLADAFREFDADPDASVAVLFGAGGTFCSGADLGAVGTPAGNRVAPDGDGPMGQLLSGQPTVQVSAPASSAARSPSPCLSRTAEICSAIRSS
jgi:enoyl-CoA hydratase